MEPVSNTTLRTSCKCGFCKEPGHRIDTCHHPSGLELLKNCEFKCEIAMQYFNSPQYAETLLIQIIKWLNERTIRELKLLVSNTSYKIHVKKDQLIAAIIIEYYCRNAYSDWINSNYAECNMIETQKRLNKISLYWRFIYIGYTEKKSIEKVEEYAERNYA